MVPNLLPHEKCWKNVLEISEWETLDANDEVNDEKKKKNSEFFLLVFVFLIVLIIKITNDRSFQDIRYRLQKKYLVKMILIYNRLESD